MSGDAGGVRTVAVGKDDADQRLDRWFKRHFPSLTHGRLEKLLRTGQIRVDGKRAKASLRVAAGQQVRVPPLPEASAKVSLAVGAPPRSPPISARDAAALRAAVLYEDDWVIAIDKAAGLAVQGGTGQTRHVDALLDALRAPGAERPRLVHRLDRDTSGVLLLARSLTAARRLTASFREKDAESGARKLYWALVAGAPERPRGRIDVPLAKLPGARGEKVGAAAQGKAAVTVYQMVASTRLAGSRQRVSWLLLMPLTGRTHQLRAHCVALGAPILGDGKYGGKRAFPAVNRSNDGALSKRLMLHAREIAVPHPEDGTTLRVTAPLPEDMAAAWATLGFDPRHGDAAVNDLLAYAQALPSGTAKELRPAKGRKRQ